MQVPIGPSSLLGWLTFAAGEFTAALTALTGSEAQLHGPGKWAAILGVVALVATNAGRQAQAAVLTRASTLSERPQSGVRPDGAATSTSASTSEGEPV